VGFGPGGNLRHIAIHHKPRLLLGADISQKMCDLATRNLRSFDNIRLTKTDGTTLPFEERSIDTSFTVTVLQHVTHEPMLRALVQEICRVTRDTIIIMEDIGPHQHLAAQGAGVNRTLGAYSNVFAEHGFQLHAAEFLNTRVSRRWYEFAWRVYCRLFAQNHHEGDQINFIGKLLIGTPLVVTRALDDFFVAQCNLSKIVFTCP
jgi:SAM-dependent methyltransferase